ncbi:MAG: ATP-dependent Clp protease ATP-binding subunit [Mycobacterium sp.]|nr:ATP-dependent Clp protease ATP-binding subunit [Mycobacterium sp.]
MTPPPSLDELIRVVQADSPSDSPLDQLATAAIMINTLNDTGDAVLGHFVDKSRGAGNTWTEISNVLGVTKQAVHKRFSFAAATMVPTFERFTHRARNVLKQARTEADDLGHPYIGTEHLLLAQFIEPESVAVQILAKREITREAVAAAVLGKVAKGDNPSSDAAYTPRLKHMLEAAVSEALNMGHNYIGTEHMLLAFYQEPNSIGTQVLTELGADVETVRADVVAALVACKKK